MKLGTWWQLQQKQKPQAEAEQTAPGTFLLLADEKGVLVSVTHRPGACGNIRADVTGVALSPQASAQ